MPKPVPRVVSQTLYYRHPSGRVYSATGYGETEPDACEHALAKLDRVLVGPLAEAVTESALSPAERRNAQPVERLP